MREMIKLKHKKIMWGNTFIVISFFLFSLLFIIPFLYVISASLTEESVLLEQGFKLIPTKIDFSAYKAAFINPTQIMQAYGVTIFTSFLGTFLATFVMALCAYPLSRKNYALGKVTTFIIFFTMLFSGGLIPSYIINTQMLGLYDNVWVYIFPGLVNAFQIIVFRTFFQGLPESLPESAKIDGASELRIFFQIILPLSKPVVATIALLQLLDKWNNWFTSLIYIKNEDLFTLQYLLQKILRDAEFMKNMMMMGGQQGVDFNTFAMPTESLKFALCIIATGPMLFLFPFFQKYFSKGLTVGAVKG